ncbi:uncharacterized protein LOC123524539 [Mercenaria mercenaria]|uniref:uncharacterized protein LOC123524539 n=1 Tax=Mercenaria mercenaria TaxID=6596 RepID=UPI00234F3023|nr:uncharacterized protein LOC123524539 [Mercenaria mercenaria]
MENETAIERSIKEFVYSKIQEQVYLDVSKSNTITVKHQSKHGSIALAMFWLRVLRHQNNYPMPKYPYKQLYDKNGSNKVILKVDSVTLTTFNSTGTLMIQGHFVLEWFVNVFPTIILAYDAPIKDPQRISTAYSQYTESWKQLTEDDRVKKALEDKEIKEREDHAIQVADTLDTVLDTVNAEVEKYDTQSTVVSQTDTTGLAERLKVAQDTVANQLAEELKLMSLDVWSGDTLQEQLDNIRTGCVRDGATFIYKLWKSVLHHWFSDPDRKIYIVTPFLDASRLVDVCNIILEHRLEADLDAFYVRQKCDYTRDIFEVKQNALEKYDAKDQMFIEYKIFSNIIYPLKRFHAKFIGCIKGNEAEVLITSANFHGDHFEYSNMDSVQYQTMSDVEFISQFLQPINASVLERK